MQGYRLLCAVVALSIAAPVLALEMSTPDGWYLEANIGSGRLSNADGQSGNGPAYNLNLGYKIMPYAAIEAGYTKYKNSKLVGDAINSVGQIVSITYASFRRYSYDIAAKSILPLVDTSL